MTLAEVRETNPHWTIIRVQDGLLCTYQEHRFLAYDEDDAQDEITTRDPPPGSLAEFSAHLDGRGF